MTAHYTSPEPEPRRGLKHDLLISSYDKQRLMHFAAQCRCVIRSSRGAGGSDLGDSAGQRSSSDANYDQGKISILAPLGTSLLGYRVGDVVYWHVPRGIRQLRIDEIVYQPEASGHYHL